MWQFEAIEDKIIHLIIKDREFAILVLNELDANLFTNVTCERMIKVIKQYHNKYNGIPELDEVKTLISGSPILSKNFDFIEAERIYGDMELKPSEIDFVKDAVPKFIKHSNFKKLITMASAEIYKNDTPDTQEEIYSSFEEKFKKIRRYNMDRDIGHKLFDVKGRYARLKNKFTGGIKPSLENLQKIIKGYFKKEAYAYMGDTGAGKSILLINDALSAVKQGFNVVYVSLELEPQDLALRIDQNVSSKESYTLLKDIGTVDYLEKKYADIKKLTGAGEMFLKEYPNGSATCNTIQAYLELLEMYEDFKCDFLIIDYMDIMKPNEGFTNSDYRDQAKIANEISALAKELDIPILSAMQANRAGREEDGVKKVLDKNRVADSYGKLRPLYGVYSINSKGGNDVILNKHFLFVNKNRNGPADVRANFIMNKMLMQVKDDVEIEDEEEQFE
jgi:replicative DNA helicase